MFGSGGSYVNFGGDATNRTGIISSNNKILISADDVDTLSSDKQIIFGAGAETVDDVNFVEYMRINEGNVGIGTTTPSEDLTVSGRMHVTSRSAFGTSNIGSHGAMLTIKPDDPNTSTGILITGADGDVGTNRLLNIDSVPGGNILTALSSGNVGIGDPSPSAKLQVTQLGTGDSLVINDSASDITPFLIDANGNVGIGTTSITANTKLEITSNNGLIQQRITSADERASLVLAGNDTVVGSLNAAADGSALQIGYGPNYAADIAVSIPSSGNVGIGTTSPQARLHVSSGHVLLDNNQSLSFLDSSGVANNILTLSTGNITQLKSSDGENAIWLRNNDTIEFFTANTERLSIESTGNVGIGTTSPQRRLHVASPNWVIAALEGSGSKAVLELINSNGGASDESEIRFVDDSTTEWGIGYREAENRFEIADGGLLSGTPRFVISSSGNVGVGTTTPNAKLTVAGNINIDDPISAISILGARVLYASTTNSSTLVGFQAGTMLTETALFNTAMGRLALRSATSSSDNTAVGYAALQLTTSGYGNTAVGRSVLSNNTVGVSNTAMGSLALQTNISGGYNTAIGVSALRLNTTGSSNTSLGNYSLESNTTGSSNVAIGRGAANYNTTGEYNVAVGGHALRNNAAGVQHTMLGRHAGYDVNTATSTGANTFLGYNTGRGIVTGVNNTIVGANVTGLSSALSNHIILADGAGNKRIVVDGSGNVGIGTTSPSSKLSVSGDVTFAGLTGATGAGSLCLNSSNEVVYNSGSDACLPSLRETKHDIKTLSFNALDMISSLEPVSFVYNQGDGRTRYGFIAEDVAHVDELLATYSADGELSGIDDRSMIAVLATGVQEVWRMMEELFVKDAAQDELLAAQQAEIDLLKAEIAALKGEPIKDESEEEEVTQEEEEKDDEEENKSSETEDEPSEEEENGSEEGEEDGVGGAASEASSHKPEDNTASSPADGAEEDESKVEEEAGENEPGEKSDEEIAESTAKEESAAEEKAETTEESAAEPEESATVEESVEPEEEVLE